jgi:hypothetical protein
MAYQYIQEGDVPTDGYYVEKSAFYLVGIVYQDPKNVLDERVHSEVVFEKRDLALASVLAKTGIPLTSVYNHVVKAL